MSVGLVNGLIAIVLALEVVSAQPAPIRAQEIERARQLLNSSQWVDKAWGAYLAARLRSQDLDRQLIEQFRSAIALRDSQWHTDEHAFLAVLFDGLIEAGITAPAALLEPFEKNWTAPVLILLARDKDSEDSLMRFRAEKSRHVVWLAANNLLFERRSQRWYQATLGEISIRHRFTVTDSGGPGFGAGLGGSSCGDGVAAMPKGFPPVTLYTLQAGAERGSVLLAKGPESAYYKRTIVPTDEQVGVGSCETVIDRMAIRIGYLAQLRLDSVEETERLFHSETHIQYTSPDDFEREVERSMKAQDQGIRAFIHSLEKQGLSARGMRLEIVAEVDDKRQGATGPLPVVAPRIISLD